MSGSVLQVIEEVTNDDGLKARRTPFLSTLTEGGARGILEPEVFGKETAGPFYYYSPS